MKVAKLKLLLRLVGVAIFIAVLATIDLKHLGGMFLEADKLLFFSVLLLVGVPVVIKAVRWKMILATQKVSVSSWQANIMYWKGMSLSSITPGRVGELSRAYFVKGASGSSLLIGFFSVLVDRMYDLLVLTALGAVAALYFSSFMHGSFTISLAIAGILLFGVVLVFIKPGLISKASRFAIRRLLPNRYAKDADSAAEGFFRMFRALTLLDHARLLAMSALGWLIAYLAIYWLAAALTLDISFIFVVLALSLGSLISMVPISFSGIGTRDALFAALFVSAGYNAEAGIALSFCVLATYLLNILVGAFFWWIYPK